MRVNLFGVGTKSTSPAITAERRINCYVSRRQEQDRTQFALIARPGLVTFVNNLTASGSPSRGMWTVNSLTTPLLFTVHGSTLLAITFAGAVSTIGTLSSTAGDVFFADDGRYLVLVDGTNGYWYDMSVGGPLNVITDGNFTTSPGMVAWQDQYFIVTSANSRQFQMSQISPSVSPAVWPANQINFAASGSGSLKGCISNHGILHLFGDVYTEFWQNAGTADFPFALIPGAASEFGLVSPASLTKFDGAVTGLFTNKLGAMQVAQIQGFNLKPLSDQDMESIFTAYTTVANAKSMAFNIGSHPHYVITFPSMTQTWAYDKSSNIWAEWQDTNNTQYTGLKFAAFQNKLVTSDRSNGTLYFIDAGTFTDAGAQFGMEVWTKHLWEDDKYIGVSQVQVDIEAGSGLSVGQGSAPVMDLQVSKDGGNTFASVGFASMGPIGGYAVRLIWNTLGAARDWIFKLRSTEPIHRVITGASATLQKASF